MPGFSSGGIFLSYRRQDTAADARLLQFKLRERFPGARVFMDLDSIEPGLDFVEVIRKAVESCAVLVVLIGPQWVTLKDEEGSRRLDAPDDYVRFEVETALERDVRVFPVLVNGARPLRQQQLPSELNKLAQLNAVELSYNGYEYEVDRLLDAIQRVLDAVAGTGTAHESSSAGKTAAHAAHAPKAEPDGNAVGEAAPKDPEPLRSDRARVVRVLADAEQVARSITNEYDKAWALVRVATALTATDPNRADRLITDAERAARSIINESDKASALAAVAKALAATDPRRADRLITDAERAARSITDESDKAWALVNVVWTLAVPDPDRVERLAQSIRDWVRKGFIAQVLAATDPDRAERIAQSITDESDKAFTLTIVAKALAVTDLSTAARLIADAESIARSIPKESDRASVLAAVATALAATGLDHAERVARSISDEYHKASALAAVAKALAATDPRRADRLITDAERAAQSFADSASSFKFEKERLLADIAEALAATDPDRAERIAQSITDKDQKASTLADIAEALAATDPDRAERIAQSITDEKEKVRGLVEIAKI